jgi:hypothetical protein
MKSIRCLINDHQSCVSSDVCDCECHGFKPRHEQMQQVQMLADHMELCSVCRTSMLEKMCEIGKTLMHGVDREILGR